MRRLVASLFLFVATARGLWQPAPQCEPILSRYEVECLMAGWAIRDRFDTDDDAGTFARARSNLDTHCGEIAGEALIACPFWREMELGAAYRRWWAGRRKARAAEFATERRPVCPHAADRCS
jgi:hypothetical protein